MKRAEDFGMSGPATIGTKKYVLHIVQGSYIVENHPFFSGKTWQP